MIGGTTVVSAAGGDYGGYGLGDFLAVGGGKGTGGERRDANGTCEGSAYTASAGPAGSNGTGGENGGLTTPGAAGKGGDGGTGPRLAPCPRAGAGGRGGNGGLGGSRDIRGYGDRGARGWDGCIVLTYRTTTE
jgi:hypothetical protein